MTLKADWPSTDDDQEAEAEYVALAHTPTPPFIPASETELRLLVKHLNVKKASGLDEVSNRMLMNAPRPVILHLLTLFNNCMAASYFPSAWKTARLVLIPKPGKDPTIPTNRRPISLLSNISKMFEKIIKNRLDIHLRTNDVIRPEQMGFRQGLSTQLQSLRLAEYVAQGFQRRMQTAAVFLDVAKAFDQVWHKGLILKLCRANIPLNLSKLIQSFLHERSFQVAEGGELSQARGTNCGVPQGAILSPTIFNLYVNDLPSSPQSQIFMFADDTALAAQSWNGNYAVRKLQTHLSLLEKWTVSSKMTINAANSSLVVFKRNRKTILNSLTFNSSKIPMDIKHKFLGLHFDSKLLWTVHVNAAMRSAIATRVALSCLLNSRAKISRQDKVTLYKSYIRPRLLYGCEVFGSTSLSNIKRLETFQNRTLRYITNQRKLIPVDEIRRAHKVPKIHEFIKAQAVRLKNSLPRNELTENLWDYPIQDKTFKSYRLPQEILFR